jgi:hypothetical protein
MRMLHIGRSKMMVLVGTIGVAASLTMAGQALAAPAHSSSAPNVRAELRAAIKAQLKYNPHGKVIDANQVSYDHGAMVVTLVVAGEQVSPDYTCPSGDFCFFTRPGLRGDGYAANPANYSHGTFHRISTWYPNHIVGSVHNKWAHRVFLSLHNPPSSGPNLCYPPTGTGSPDEILYWAYFGTSNTC